MVYGNRMKLIGHGTGKLLSETSEGCYNFDFEERPISPLKGKQVEKWYRPGELYTSCVWEVGNDSGGVSGFPHGGLLFR